MIKLEDLDGVINLSIIHSGKFKTKWNNFLDESSQLIDRFQAFNLIVTLLENYPSLITTENEQLKQLIKVLLWNNY